MRDDKLCNEFISGFNGQEKKEPDYELVDKLVERYQGGDENAAEELLRQLRPYMSKFFKILRLGSIDLSDRDSRKFINLFIDDENMRSKLKKAYQSTDARNEAYRATALIQSMCTSIPSEDIIHELILVLLTLAKRYSKTKKKVNFCGYLYNAFRFELARRIKQITFDPLTHCTDLTIPYDDSDYSNGNDEPVEESIQIYVDEPLAVLEDELGNSWARGLTCGDMFSKLTQLQRIILKMHYMDGEGDSAIGERLGIHRTTVKRQRTCAEEILKKARDSCDK